MLELLDEQPACANAASKKLVYIVNQVTPDSTTHFYHLLNLMKALRERGWDVVLVSEKGGEGEVVIGGQSVRYLHRNPLKRVMRLTALLSELRKEGFSLVFVRISLPVAIISSVWGRLIGMRALYWQSGANYDIDRRKPFGERVWHDTMFGIARRLVFRFVTGPETMIAYYRDVMRVDQRKLRLLYNDIDTKRFAPCAGGAGERAERPFRILLVHRFSPIRETARYIPGLLKVMMEAAQRRPIEFVLIGDGPELEEVRALIPADAPGLEVRFLGPIPNEALPTHFRNADLFLMASQREGFPRVLIEAMAAGLPIVSTDAGGSRDVLGPLQQPFVANKDRPDILADCLARLLADEVARARVSAENLERVRQFSTPAVAAMFDRLLCDALPAA